MIFFKATNVFQELLARVKDNTNTRFRCKNHHFYKMERVQMFMF